MCVRRGCLAKSISSGDIGVTGTPSCLSVVIAFLGWQANCILARAGHKHQRVGLLEEDTVYQRAASVDRKLQDGEKGLSILLLQPGCKVGFVWQRLLNTPWCTAPLPKSNMAGEHKGRGLMPVMCMD